MYIHFTQQEMNDITLECAMKTLKRVDMPYTKTVALIPILGTMLPVDMTTSVIQVLAELLKEEPMELLEEALKLEDAVIEAVELAKEIKKEQQ